MSLIHAPPPFFCKGGALPDVLPAHFRTPPDMLHAEASRMAQNINVNISRLTKINFYRPAKPQATCVQACETELNLL